MRWRKQVEKIEGKRKPKTAVTEREVEMGREMEMGREVEMAMAMAIAKEVEMSNQRR